MEDIIQLFNNLSDFLGQVPSKDGVFEYDHNGIKIRASVTPKCTSLTYEYDSTKDENSKAKQINNNFEAFIKQLDDDFLGDILEDLGEKSVKAIDECLNSGDWEKILAGINKFMLALRKVAKSRMDNIDAEIKKLQSYKNTYIDAANKKF